jgi:hypothetical protein
LKIGNSVPGTEKTIEPKKTMKQIHRKAGKDGDVMVWFVIFLLQVWCDSFH